MQFGYRPGEKVIRNLSFVAEPGKVTALVGPSGGGKSTILNLILRFYEVDGGAIVIDGQNIAGVSRRSLRGQLAYVGQDVFLFRGSVRDNIALGRSRCAPRPRSSPPPRRPMRTTSSWPSRAATTPRSASTACRSSGGERQRIAVARALLKDAPIILLDEATASLDSESERQVQGAIEHLCQGRTTIVIAHRLHTVVACRPHLRDRGRSRRRIRPPRRAAAQGRALRVVLPPAAARSGAEPAGRRLLTSSKPKERP